MNEIRHAYIAQCKENAKRHLFLVTIAVGLISALLVVMEKFPKKL